MHKQTKLKMVKAAYVFLFFAVLAIEPPRVFRRLF